MPADPPPRYPERVRLRRYTSAYPDEKNDATEAMYSSTDEDFPFEEKVEAVKRMTKRSRRSIRNPGPPTYTNASPPPPRTSSPSKGSSLPALFLNNRIGVLLPIAIVPIVLHYIWKRDSHVVPVFIFSILAIPPLIAVLLFALDEAIPQVLKVFRRPLRASLYNAPQIIIGTFCMHRHEYTIVKSMIFGSVVSNILLALGISFLRGGMLARYEYFDRCRGRFYSEVLLFGVSLTLMPTLFFSSLASTPGHFKLSHATSIIALLFYTIYMSFLQRPHKLGGSQRRQTRSKLKKGYTIRSNARINARDIGRRKRAGIYYTSDDPGTGKFEWTIHIFFVAIPLVIATTLLVFCSMALADSIEHITELGLVRPAFIGTIILPLATNLNDQVSAAIVAGTDIDVSIDLLMSATIDEILGTFPFLAVCSWIANPTSFMVESMTMEFQNAQAVLLFASVLVVGDILKEGRFTWCFGVPFVGVFCLIGLASWYLPG